MEVEGSGRPRGLRGPRGTRRDRLRLRSGPIRAGSCPFVSLPSPSSWPTSTERPRRDDLGASDLMNQLVRHELFAIDVQRDGQEEEDHAEEDRHVGVRLAVLESGQDLQRNDDREDAEPYDADNEACEGEGGHRTSARGVGPDDLGHGSPLRTCSRWSVWCRLDDLIKK